MLSRRSLSFVLLIATAALAIGACGGGPVLVDIETPPSELVVELADLPSELSLRIDAEETREVATPDAVANLSDRDAESIRSERVTGFQSQFRGSELTVVACQAGLYRSTAGSTEAMRIQTERFEARVESGEITGERVALENELGEASWALRGAGGGIQAFVLVWRFRNVLSSCTIVGALAADEAQAVLIARAQQTRIVEALS